jgi:hypothetical protein
MEFKEIAAISGMPGLYQVVNSKSNGMIVKSLDDGRSQFVSSRIHGISALDTISLYLTGGETVDLKSILQKIFEQEEKEPLPNLQDKKALQAAFEKLVPGYDKEKVHESDMKKLFRWYHQLKKHNVFPIPVENVEAEENSKEEKK